VRPEVFCQKKEVENEKKLDGNVTGDWRRLPIEELCD
jgi:hypothetical protein